jgi:hypothetical protein
MRVKGKRWRKRFIRKAAGDERVLIPGRGSGLVGKAGSDTIPNTAGGE